MNLVYMLQHCEAKAMQLLFCRQNAVAKYRIDKNVFSILRKTTKLIQKIDYIKSYINF